MDPAAAGSIRAGLPLPAGAVGVPMDMEEAAAAAGAEKMPAGAAAAREPAWTLVSAPVAWAGAAAPPAGALVAPAAAAPSPPAWARPSARLVLALAAALYLVGCAEAGLALHAMIHPPGKPCAPNAESLPTASQYLVMGMSAQVIAFAMALVPPAWSVVVSETVLGTFVAYYFPAQNVLWLLATCDGELALVFWLMYVIMWPPAFAILAALSLKS